MELVICAIRDVKLNSFGRPMFFNTLAQGVRSFKDEVLSKSQDNILNKHPEDFALYLVGVYEDSTCGFNLKPQPELVVQASSLVELT